MPEDQPTYTGSVRVMQSYNYCHFEVQLATSEPLTLAGVDDLRKRAARLCDKAIEQYKVAKDEAEKREKHASEYAYHQRTAARIREIAEGDRSEREKALLKSFEDSTFHARRRYDYEDNWNEPDDEDND